MNYFKKFYGHFSTITKHKILVMKYCFKVGLYKQGLLHDMSKYTLTEFLNGIKYFQGTRSPNNAEREAKGYSEAWIHHKGRNKHHFEYWMDYSLTGEKDIVGVPIPFNFIAEMFCDRVSASKIYMKNNYSNDDPYNYFVHSKDQNFMHHQSKKDIENLLLMLKEKGEENTINHLKKILKDNKTVS